MHVLKVQQRRLLWNVCIRTGMLAPPKSMANLQLTPTRLEFPPRSPASHGGAVAPLAWSDLSVHLLDKILTWFRETLAKSLHWCTWAKTLLKSLQSSGFKCLVCSCLYWKKYANKQERWRLLSGFWQDQTHTDLFYFSTIICSGCNMQYPHCNKPSPFVYHHTIAGNQIREVWETATPPATTRAGVSGPVLPSTSGEGTCMLAGSVPLLRSGNFQLRQWKLPKLIELNTCDYPSVSLVWAYIICGYVYLIHLNVLVSLPYVYYLSPKLSSLRLIQSMENSSHLEKL